MKLLYLILAFTLINTNLMAQTKLEEGKDFIRESDPANPGSEMLVGQVDDFILTEFDTEGWYKEGKEYEADQETVIQINKIIAEGGYEIFVFLGTWCGDTKHLLPEFMSVMGSVDQSQDMMKMFAVDRAKKALNIESEIFDIKNIPTFIFYKNNVEVGRIVESVEKSIESAILNVLESK